MPILLFRLLALFLRGAISASPIAAAPAQVFWNKQFDGGAHIATAAKARESLAGKECLDSQY
jgi:hypothetical protein